MKTIKVLLISALTLLSTGVLNAAPWDRTRSSTPSRHNDSRTNNSRFSPPRFDDSRHRGRHGTSFQDRLEVKAQIRLRQLGYYRGPIDGSFGRGSRLALTRFQRDARLPRTGHLDIRTVRALRIR